MSGISKKQFKTYIDNFDFTNIFNQLGWTFIDVEFPVKFKEETFIFQSVAEKGGFQIIVFKPDHNKNIPDYATRLQLDRKIGKLYREHIIIFCDSKKTIQIWQLFVKQMGKPSRLSETRWNKGQEPELLYQKTANLFFTLDDEENITISDVVEIVNENFSRNVEQVTKKFYENFRKEHKIFIAFIKGISVVTDREWYASLMLNRLMFCYFIQKKGFLDNNIDYLKERLIACQDKKGKDKFYVSFYKNFLMALFHQGLGAPKHSEDFKNELGKIPYLNGGLFDVHELERQYDDINISDEAFLNVFNFFDQYNWHLDTRSVASGKDINPDVIGYIFEKYINDRAKMGAYYTKEDITDYISKNCILPYLFDETKRHYSRAFSADGEIWQTVKQSNDEYIYDSVKKGVDVQLPDEIEVGINNVAERTEWNKLATDKFALPTEIWREVVDRRNRYNEIKQKIENGEITGITDFITYNLNIRQFAQDVIDNTSDPDFLKAFYKSLSNITILDPTCGSGAFLFAAMNILEPLYESCIQRMENFIAEAPKGKYKFFEETLLFVKAPEHPNMKYFIFKSIILRNLYGVDIMKEAVEIAKLRLFLKLVATVDADFSPKGLKNNLGLEPLPDIDFNIRSGNTLVGFATLNDAITAVNAKDKTGQMGFVFDEEIGIINSIKNQADDLAHVFKSFKHAQLDNDLSDFKKAKEKLMNYQSNLNEILNEYLAFTYEIDSKKQKGKYSEWLNSHQPFNWFAEFYEIINDKGGFDVIIGNPPYLEIRQIDYEPKGLETFSTGAVHSMCIERSLQILSNNGNISMIVPLSIVCTQRMRIIQHLLETSRVTFYTNFAWRPGKLFENVNRALTIFVSNSINTKAVFTSKYLKWQSETRDLLFPLLNFMPWSEKRPSFWIPKISNLIEATILNKVLSSNYSVGYLISANPSNRIYYRTTGGLYWKIFTNFPPKFYLNGKAGNSSRETSFTVNEQNQDIICVALLSSNVFWWWYTVTSNLRDLNPIDIQGFKFPSEILHDNLLIKLGEKYLKDLESNSVMLTRMQKQTGETQTQSFKIAYSKPIINEIDKILAKHYGFTAEELDFIINYDIKYRMGKELENEEEEE